MSERSKTWFFTSDTSITKKIKHKDFKDKNERIYFLQNLLLFYLSLRLESCAQYACAYVDAYDAHITAFLCFVFCLVKTRLKKPTNNILGHCSIHGSS